MSTKGNQKLVLYEETHTESALSQKLQTQNATEVQQTGSYTI